MKKFFTNTGVLQVFCALMLVIGIMFVSNYYVYKNSIADIYSKVTQNNTLAVKSMIQSFDNSFRSINNAIYSIHVLPYNVWGPDDANTVNWSNVYLMQDNLTSIISSVDFIEEAIIFYDHSDLVIMASGTGSFEYTFDTKYKHDMYNSNYWRNFVRTNTAFRLFPREEFKVASSSSANQSVKKKLLIAVGGNKVRLSNKNIILIIDEAAFMKHVSQQMMIPGASLVVLDQNRQEILVTDPTLDVNRIMEEVYFNSSQETSLTKGDYQYNFYKSEFNGYNYIEVVPYQFQNIDSVAEANRKIMFIGILCAVILATLLSYYLNRPIKNILRQLGWKHSRGNDFSKIHSGIIKMKAESESYKKQLELVGMDAKRGALLYALEDSEHTDEFEIQMQQYEIELFRSKEFIMMLLQLHIDPGDEQASLPIEQLTTIIQEKLQEIKLDANVFYKDNMRFVALIGLNQANERDAILKRLQQTFAKLTKEELNAYSFFATVSKAFASRISSIKHAYRSVSNAMNFRQMNENSKVIPVEKIQYAMSIYFPLEKIEKLSNYVMNGKLAESKEIIAETIKENADRNLYHHQFMHIAKTMFYYVARHAEDSANAKEELYLLEQQFLELVERERDYARIEHALIEIAKHIIKYTSKSSRENESKLNPTFISQYIDIHYMNNLYLDQIAEVMETSPKYFSSYFKKTFGINYVEYLNKVRLSRARELLAQTNLSVAEIGEKTGYLNSSTFTTTFKKYFGISPSEYRKQKNS